MTETKLEYYKESGIASPINISLTIVSSLILILFLSYFYSLITSSLPVIYFNFLIVIGYGLTISFISKIFNTIFKIRNRKKTIVITIILSVFAVYFQWASYLFILSIEEFSLFMVFENLGLFFNILLRPDIVITNIIEINKIGLWSIGTSGASINGFFLWIVWLIEAFIIIFVSYYNFIHFKSIPFSEKDNKWFKKEIIDFDFEHIAFKKDFVNEFHINPYESISKLKSGHGIRHSKIYIYKSETESKNLISIDNIIVTQRGKGKKDITEVLKYCFVDNIYLSQLRTKYRIKKTSIF